jgi:catechol 2,3-dioxygenase
MSESQFFAGVEFTDLTLRVADVAQVQAFYEDVLGFVHALRAPGVVALAPPGASRALLVLNSAPSAPPRPRGAAGLFHVALLYPDRPALARALRRVLDLGIPIGSADHGVSEAIYLSDPEGNGLELYADRARGDWPPSDDGQVAMFTEALDLPSLLTLTLAPGSLLPAETRIGHVHLSVADLDHAEQFYGGLLGFTVTQRNYPGALFLGRDGYHHHIGANVWRSRLPALPGALGLAELTIHIAHHAERDAVISRLRDAGRVEDETGGRIAARDYDGITIAVAGQTDL